MLEIVVHCRVKEETVSVTLVHSNGLEAAHSGVEVFGWNWLSLNLPKRSGGDGAHVLVRRVVVIFYVCVASV
jgi:hypothetical protein